jgi:16S rRNA (adenine1518-N6/adenine1519-N6)-dimethyltransferase
MSKIRQPEILFKPKKSLGQNFLFDQQSLNKIVEFCLINDNSRIIEIGPGYGSLTRLLAKVSNKKVFAIEKDDKLFNWLTLNVSDENIDFVLGDALNINWESFISERKILSQKENDLIVVGNLPYNISNQILINLLENNHLFKRIIFLVQKEVGQRWVASPFKYKNKYSNFSVFVNYFCNVNLALEVLNKLFKPVPKVDGVLVCLEIKKDLPVEFNEKKFFSFIRNCFRFRRKTLFNNIKSFFGEESKIKITFEKFRYGEKIRPQDLSLQDYIYLFKEILSS